MIENVLHSLARSTPALRERYLARIRRVNAAEAREIERRLATMVEHDRQFNAA
jgi:hypothetical protein